MTLPGERGIRDPPIARIFVQFQVFPFLFIFLTLSVSQILFHCCSKGIAEKGAGVSPAHGDPHNDPHSHGCPGFRRRYGPHPSHSTGGGGDGRDGQVGPGESILNMLVLLRIPHTDANGRTGRSVFRNVQRKRHEHESEPFSRSSDTPRRMKRKPQQQPQHRCAKLCIHQAPFNHVTTRKGFRGPPLPLRNPSRNGYVAFSPHHKNIMPRTRQKRGIATPAFVCEGKTTNVHAQAVKNGFVFSGKGIHVGGGKVASNCKINTKTVSQSIAR